MRIIATCALAVASATAGAAEVTVQNDSLVNFGNASIVWGFAAGEKAASWLTSPCDGSVRAVQIFWRSPSGTTGEHFHDSIEIFRSGTFPNPGALAETIGGPVLTDGVLNEWRYIDENNVIPLAVPVAENETFVVSFTFDTPPTPNTGPSITRDTDGILPNRNALYGDIGLGMQWYDSAMLGLQGDWIIRAVVDCVEVDPLADVGVAMSADAAGYTPGQPLSYTVVVDNAGPAAAASTTIVDIFPPAFTNASWTCTAFAGGSCPAGGTGNITHIINLPAEAWVSYEITGTVAPTASGTLSNTLSAVVGGSVSDPEPDNNTATLDLQELVDDTIFANGFEDG